MVKNHSDSKRGNPLSPLYGLFCVHHSIDRIVHTMAFFIPVVEHWLKQTIIGSKDMFYLTIYSTHLWLCGVKQITKEHSGNIQKPTPTTDLSAMCHLGKRKLIDHFLTHKICQFPEAI